MKELALFLATGIVIFGLPVFAVAQDSGIPDTFYVEIYPDDQVQFEGPPHFVRFPMFVTHDIVDPVDSVGCFTAILCYEHTNLAKYCSVTSYWNNTRLYPQSGIDRSIFRHYIEEGDTVIHNWMMDQAQLEMGLEWDFRFVDLDGTSHFWFQTLPTGSADQEFGEGSKVLLASIHFKLEDTMTVCIDTCFWPPAQGPLFFVNAAAATWVPRHFMPVCESICLAPKTIYVDDDNVSGPWDGTLGHPYQHVQDGVDNANSGDTVFVFSGDYYENVEVSKQILLVGQDKQNTVIDAGGSGSCVVLTGDGVIVTGFTLQNSGGPDVENAGIQVTTSHNTITNNIFRDNDHVSVILYNWFSAPIDSNMITDNWITGNNGSNGVVLLSYGGGSHGTIVTGNTITKNRAGVLIFAEFGGIISNNSVRANQYGISFGEGGAYGVTISGNTICNNSQYGIYGDAWSYLTGNVISENHISANGDDGLSILESRSDTVRDNTITLNGDIGLAVSDGLGTIVAGNNIWGNTGGGISLGLVRDSDVSDNYVAQNAYGIRLHFNTYSNSIYDNIITSNTGCGVYVASAWDNTIYHNDLINNGTNAFNEDVSNLNVWDDGYPSGGNCWSDYIGVDTMSGPGQDIPGSDGIGDTPYEIPGGGQDNYPLLSECQYLRGDANGDELIDITDVLYMLNYLFRSGPPPVSFVAGDANCDDDLGILDPLYLLNYLYKGGPPPGC